MWLQLFKYGVGDIAQWIFMNKMDVLSVQQELCDTNFSEHIANLRIACYNGNNNRAVRALFMKQPMNYVKLWSQNPSETSSWVFLKQRPCSPAIIP